MATDLLDRELSIGDYVVFHNCIYQVHSIPNTERAYSRVKIMSINPSKTTKPVLKYSKELCIIPKEDIIVWKLKHDNRN